MDSDKLTEVLRNVRFLHDIGPMHVEQLSKVSRLRDYDENAIIFRQGDAAQYLYIVVQGNVSLEICAAGTGCRQIFTVGQDELLGWSSVLEQLSYIARSRTLEKTRLIEINVAQLLGICEQDPRFGYKVMREVAMSLAKRLSATRMQLLDIYGASLPVIPNAAEAADVH
jgi:CRP-like cAMP-binding protein